jgi:hypothetical protein
LRQWGEQIELLTSFLSCYCHGAHGTQVRFVDLKEHAVNRYLVLNGADTRSHCLFDLQVTANGKGGFSEKYILIHNISPFLSLLNTTTVASFVKYDNVNLLNMTRVVAVFL